MSEGLEEPRLRLEGEPDEERREDGTEIETEREEPEASPAEEEEALPAEEDELPRLRGSEHAAGELRVPDGYGGIEGEPPGGWGGRGGGGGRWRACRSRGPPSGRGRGGRGQRPAGTRASWRSAP